MSRRPKNPLRPLSEEERQQLIRLSRGQALAASPVARAKAVLVVADGGSYTDAARAAGRRSGDAVAALVTRFNTEGLAAVVPRHGGGHPHGYTPAERDWILAEARRPPDRERDGTAVWSLTTLRRALRRNGLPHVSTYPIWRVLADAGGRRPELAEAPVVVRHGHGPAAAAARGSGGGGDRDRSGCRGEKKRIEQAYRHGSRLGLAVWCEDEAGPYQAIPQPGTRWQPVGPPVRYPHE